MGRQCKLLPFRLRSHLRKHELLVAALTLQLRTFISNVCPALPPSYYPWNGAETLAAGVAY